MLVNYGSGSSTALETIGVIAALLGVALDLLALALVQVVVALAMERVDAGQDVTFMELFRATRAVAWTAIRAWLLYVAIAALLFITIVGIPIALWLAVRWAMSQQVIALEGRGVRDAFRRSARLVRGSWIKTAIIGVVGALLPEFLGPLVGALIIFALGVSFELANFLSTLAFLCLLPFAAAMRMYLYHDLRVRDSQRAPSSRPAACCRPSSPAIRGSCPRPRLRLLAGTPRCDRCSWSQTAVDPSCSSARPVEDRPGSPSGRARSASSTSRRAAAAEFRQR